MVNINLHYVTRINLKTDAKERHKLINFCLKNKNQQFVAFGWSCVYIDCPLEIVQCIKNYDDFYKAVNNLPYIKRINHALNVFKKTEENHLFWTRDLDGFYWICRVKGKAQPYNDRYLDIGAVVPIEGYNVGLNVPGKIKASFNRPNGGICEDIYDPTIINYSKYIFNIASSKNYYEYDKNIKGNIIDNIDAFDLEELVISYIQLCKNYYVLSNSIAKKSTTVRIECEFISRDKEKISHAVVQVKSGKQKIDGNDFREFIEKNYTVYLYAHEIVNQGECKVISREDLEEFYRNYKAILPESISCWENLVQ